MTLADRIKQDKNKGEEVFKKVKDFFENLDYSDTTFDEDEKFYHIRFNNNIVSDFKFDNGEEFNDAVFRLGISNLRYSMSSKEKEKKYIYTDLSFKVDIKIMDKIWYN